jgi:hypothetical protein
MPISLIDAVCFHPPTDLDRPACLERNDQQDLLQVLAAVPSPRRRRGARYQLACLLVVAMCAGWARGQARLALLRTGSPTWTRRRVTGFGWRARCRPVARCGVPGFRADTAVLQAVLAGWVYSVSRHDQLSPGRSDSDCCGWPVAGRARFRATRRANSRPNDLIRAVTAQRERSSPGLTLVRMPHLSSG